MLSAAHGGAKRVNEVVGERGEGGAGACGVVGCVRAGGGKRRRDVV